MITTRAPVGVPARATALTVRVAQKVRAGGRRRHRHAGPGWARAAGAALLFAGLATAWAQEPAPLPLSPPPPAYHVPTEPGELLKVDEPMRRYFGERLSRRWHDGVQLRRLVDGILQPDGLHFVYDAEGLFDAREAFRRRRGNCLSFAFLVVAVAREFGYAASFQDVDNIVHWERHGDLILAVGHISVRIDVGQATYRVDLRPDLIDGIPATDIHGVDDHRAFAQFYHTAGVFKLAEAQPAEAGRLMVRATEIDPDCADSWANLASLCSHLGDLAGARACFERALQADRHCISALDGYVSVLHRLGAPEDRRIAAQYEQRAQAIRNRNPYYQQKLAERAQEQGDWLAAEKFLRKATALKPDEPQFYEQWITVLQKLGRADDARRATVRLEKLRRRPGAVPVQPGP